MPSDDNTSRGRRRLRSRDSPAGSAARAATACPAEREKLSALRKKYAARSTPAAKSAKQAKATPAGRAGGKEPTPRKSTAKNAVQKPKPAPIRDFGDRFIDRVALGYAPAGKMKGP
ncbi:hypothetical protein AB0G71_01840 [Streptomyces sp. NPDC020403]|uniref:hypothetical protein n=1 Tax=unclassified Streptomyces TaxID=2593676 RepID=UPI003406D508